MTKVTGSLTEIREGMVDWGWFMKPGVYTVFDGQFGSTGKGVLCSLLAELFKDKIDINATSAGPNSGHTICSEAGALVFHQIPSAYAYDRTVNKGQPQNFDAYLCAGAIINPSILATEVRHTYPGSVMVHPHAAVVPDEYEDAVGIASTGQGVGPAMIKKMERKGHRDEAIMKHLKGKMWEKGLFMMPHTRRDWSNGTTLMEIAQGWGLGINSGIYPYVTARECSVAQGLSDLGASPMDHRKSIMSMRTYPIRVGNTKRGFSGPGWDKNHMEITWDHLGVRPELTSTTHRERRVFGFSMQQYRDALKANKPDAVFMNFMNYLPPDEQENFATMVVDCYTATLERPPDFVLFGWGPSLNDIEMVIP